MPSKKRKAARTDGAGTKSLADQAYTRLEEMIVTLVLPPGGTRTEQALSKELKIGRTPVREALQRLEREGLVVIRPRMPILITETAPSEELRVLEIRRELERLLARTGAERATPAQRRRFSEIADEMLAAAQADNGLAFVRLDGELNALLAEAAHNKYAARVMQLLNGHSRRFWYLHSGRATDLRKVARLHAMEARAIAEGKARRAMAASDTLIDYVEKFTRAIAGEWDANSAGVGRAWWPRTRRRETASLGGKPLTVA